MKTIVRKFKKAVRRNERRMKETKKAKRALGIVALTIFAILAIQTLISTANSSKTITIENENWDVRIEAESPKAQPEAQDEAKDGVVAAPREETKLVEVESPSEVVRMIEEKFPEEPKLAVAIAKAESGLRTDAVGDGHIEFVNEGKVMGHSCGLFQVRVLPGRPDCETLKDPARNLEFARKLYEKSGWKPWSAYTNQSYLKHL